MKHIFPFVTLLAVVAMSTMAQTTANRRMIIKTADGTTRVYDASRVSRVTFDEVTPVSVPLTLVSAAGYSVKVHATMPQGCSQYLLATIPAGEQPADLVNYIINNAAVTANATKDLELGGLQPESNYTVYSLAYDAYGMVSGISSLDVSTIQATDAEKPKVGYILYADGSWSRRLDKTRTPIGIIFSTTTSQADQERGWKLGYAIALRDAAQQIAWATTIGENQAGAIYTSATAQGFITDKDGYSHTDTLAMNKDRHPAVAAALDYTVTAPARSSGWYLPSSGQWYDICVNLGGADSIMNVQGTYEGYWNTPQIVSNTLSLLNEHMSIAGKDNYEPITVASGDYRWYWCSSESGNEQAYAVFFDQDQLVVEIAPYFKTYAFSTNRVRAVIAF